MKPDAMILGLDARRWLHLTYVDRMRLRTSTVRIADGSPGRSIASWMSGSRPPPTRYIERALSRLHGDGRRSGCRCRPLRWRRVCS
jgi:hypothetical protein